MSQSMIAGTAQSNKAFKLLETSIPDARVIAPPTALVRNLSAPSNFSLPVHELERRLRAPLPQTGQSLALRRGEVRGLRYSPQAPGAYLLSVNQGECFAVGVDLRCVSPYAGCWTGVYLSAANARRLWLPPGFAWGLMGCETRNAAQIRWTGTGPGEALLAHDDPDLGVRWPLRGLPRALQRRTERGGCAYEDASLFLWSEN